MKKAMRLSRLVFPIAITVAGTTQTWATSHSNSWRTCVPYEERLSFEEQMQEYEEWLRAYDQCWDSYDEYLKRGALLNCGLPPRKPVEGEDIYDCVPPGYIYDGIRLIAPPRGFTDSDFPLLVWELKDEFRGRIEVRLHSDHRTIANWEQTGVFEPGYYGIDLRLHDTALEPSSAELHWDVGLVDGRTNIGVGSIEGPRFFRTGLSRFNRHNKWYDTLKDVFSVDANWKAKVIDIEALREVMLDWNIED